MVCSTKNVEIETLLVELHHLVPRLCLRTHGIAGSACHGIVGTKDSRGRASKTARSQAGAWERADQGKAKKSAKSTEKITPMCLLASLAKTPLIRYPMTVTWAGVPLAHSYPVC